MLSDFPTTFLYLNRLPHHLSILLFYSSTNTHTNMNGWQLVRDRDVELSKFLNANRVLGLYNACSDLHVMCDLRLTLW